MKELTNFAINLKYLRTEKGYTQTELAKQLKISIKSVSHWETAYSEPSISQLIEIADFFGVSIDELVSHN